MGKKTKIAAILGELTSSPAIAGNQRLMGQIDKIAFTLQEDVPSDVEDLKKYLQNALDGLKGFYVTPDYYQASFERQIKRPPEDLAQIDADLGAVKNTLLEWHQALSGYSDVHSIPVSTLEKWKHDFVYMRDNLAQVKDYREIYRLLNDSHILSALDDLLVSFSKERRFHSSKKEKKQLVSKQTMSEIVSSVLWSSAKSFSDTFDSYASLERDDVNQFLIASKTKYRPLHTMWLNWDKYGKTPELTEKFAEMTEKKAEEKKLSFEDYVKLRKSEFDKLFTEFAAELNSKFPNVNNQLKSVSEQADEA